eukprot:673442_1
MDDIKEEKYDGKRGSDRDRKQSKIKIEIKDNDDDDDVYVPEPSDDEDDDNTQENAISNLNTKSDYLDEEERKILNDLEKQKPKHNHMQANSTSIEDIEQHINEQYGQKLNDQLDALQNISNSDDEEEEKNSNLSTNNHNNHHELDTVGLIGGRSRGLSKGGNAAPPPLSIEKIDEDATDYFSLSGSNLKTARSSVTCTRNNASGSIHSAFGTQLVSRGRIEWMIKIDTGHSIRIGVCGTTQDSTDRPFTETKYGYGYGDDGNIYFGGSHIEYNDGFKAGDIIGVYLNMDMNTLKFSVNGSDHGAAFDSIKLNEKDNVNGYRLAVSLQHRPHKLTLLESNLYNVERRSPRPNSNQFNINNKKTNGHQRKLSYKAMTQKPATSITSSVASSDNDDEKK